MKRRLLLSFAAWMIFAGLGHAALADTNPSFTLTLAKPYQSAVPGQTLSFSGTIANTGSTTINLDGDNLTSGQYTFINPYTNPTCTGSVPCFDDSPFFNNAPFFLNANSSYTGLLFYIIVPTTATLGSLTDAFNIVGDSGSGTFTTNSVLFSTTVTPEPSTWLLMGTGLAGIFLFSRRTGAQDAIRSTLS